jgi:hypothetical protein
VGNNALDRGGIGDEGNDARARTAVWTDQGEGLEQALEQNCPQVMRRGVEAWGIGSGSGSGLGRPPATHTPVALGFGQAVDNVVPPNGVRLESEVGQ